MSRVQLRNIRSVYSVREILRCCCLISCTVFSLNIHVEVEILIAFIQAISQILSEVMQHLGCFPCVLSLTLSFMLFKSQTASSLSLFLVLFGHDWSVSIIPVFFLKSAFITFYQNAISPLLFKCFNSSTPASFLVHNAHFSRSIQFLMDKIKSWPTFFLLE